MKFIPKKQKFKKQQKGKNLNKIGPLFLLNNLKFGSIGLKSINSSRLKSHQLESIFRSIKKIIKKTGKITLKVFPQTPITKKPIEVRMGKGKGNVDHWISKINAGTIICEVESKFIIKAKKAISLAQIRLPFKTKIIYEK